MTGRGGEGTREATFVSDMSNDGRAARRESGGERFTAYQVHRLTKKAKRKHPRSKLGNKSIAKDPRLGEAEG